MNYGESNEGNAKRELFEEIGIDMPLEDFKLLGQYKYDKDKIRCFGNIFHIILPDEGKNLKLKGEEVRGIVYLTQDEII